MVLNRKFLSLITLLFGFVLHVCGQIKEGANAKQYGILCDIYNLAANPPTSLYDAKQVEKIRSEIDVINTSLSGDSWFSEISEQGSNDSLTGRFKYQNRDGSSNWNRLKDFHAKFYYNSTKFTKLPSTNPSVKLAQIKLKKIEEHVEKLIKNIHVANTEADLGGIKKDFDDAIGEIGIGTTTSDREVECGNPGKGTAGTMAGKNLVVDFLCLCARPWYSDGLPNVCGPEIKIYRWDKASGKGECKADENGEETWKILKEGCEGRSNLKIAEPTAGDSAMAEFLTAISQDITTPKKDKPGLFGSLNTDPWSINGCTSGVGCSGRNCKASGACLYYGKNGKLWGKEISWVQNFKRGLEKLVKAQNKTASIQADITLLKMLQIRAEEIYEEAKMTLELERANPEEPTAHSATYSHGYINSFFLPWMMLI